MNRVFSSLYARQVSSLVLKFYKANKNDSEYVIIGFMHDYI